MRIRSAGRDDLMALVTFLISEFHAEYSASFPPVDVTKTVTYVAQHIEHGIVLVAEDETGLIGTVSAMPAEYWFSRQAFLSEGFFYVRKDKRVSRAAHKLIRALKDYADTQNLPLMCGVSSGDDVERKDKFFERNGLKRIGGLYLSLPQ